MVGAIALILFCILLLGPPALSGLHAGQAVTVFEAFYRSGALVFGGGHVMLPLLQQQTVLTGWISPNDFLAGYGATQAVPGPSFTFAAFLGWMMAEAPNHSIGALLATAGIFLPSLLFVLAALPYWQALGVRPSMTALLAGVNAAVVGLLATALYSPVWTSAVLSGLDFSIAAIGFFLLTRGKVPPLGVVVLCALAGVAEATLIKSVVACGVPSTQFSRQKRSTRSSPPSRSPWAPGWVCRWTTALCNSRVGKCSLIRRSGKDVGMSLLASTRWRGGPVKVLYITGYAENVVLNGGHAQRNMHVLTKPLTMDTLARQIKDFIVGVQRRTDPL